MVPLPAPSNRRRSDAPSLLSAVHAVPQLLQQPLEARPEPENLDPSPHPTAPSPPSKAHVRATLAHHPLRNSTAHVDGPRYASYARVVLDAVGECPLST